MLPSQSTPDTNQLIVEDQQREEQTTQKEDKKPSLKVPYSVTVTFLTAFQVTVPIIYLRIFITSAVPITFPSKAPISVPFLHQALEVEEPADNVQLQTDGGTLQPDPEPEQILEDHRPTAAQTQDPALSSAAHHHVSAAEPQDNLNSFSPQHDVPNR